MKNKLYRLKIIICTLLCISYFINASNIPWKKALVDSKAIPVYASKNKIEPISFLSGVFYIRKAGTFWEVKRDAYPEVHGYIDLNDTNKYVEYTDKMKELEPYRFTFIPENADYIDLLILKIKKEGIKTNVLTMKSPVKVIDYFERVLRKNQKNMDEDIPIIFSKKDIVFLTGIKMKLIDLCSDYETDLRYTRNRKDALKLLTYAKSAIDINDMIYEVYPSLAEKKCLRCYSYAASAYEFLDNPVKTLKYYKLAERYQMLADTYITLGNERGAIKYLKKVLEDYKKKHVPLTKADPLYKFNDFASIGYHYTKLIEALIRHKEYDEALMYAKEFQSLFESTIKLYHGDKTYFQLDEDKPLYLQVKIYSQQGKESEALAILNKILKRYKATHAVKDKFSVLFKNVANVYFKSRAYRESIRYNLMALDAKKDKEYLFDIFQVYNQMIDAALQLHTKESEMMIKKVSDAMYASVKKQSKLKRYEMRFVALEMAGDIFQKIGKYDEAAFTYLIVKNNNWDNEGEGRAEFASILLKLAKVKDKQGDTDKALMYTKKALKEKVDFYGENHSDTGRIYDDLSQLYFNSGNYAEAYRYASLSFNIFLKNRDQIFTLFNQKEKEEYLRSKTNKVNLLLNSANFHYLILDKNQKSLKVNEILHNTFHAWLNYKGSIFDSENAIATLNANTKDPVFKEKIDNLLSSKRRLAKLYQALPKPSERKQWQNNIKQTEEKIATLTSEISSKASSFKEAQGLKSISYKDISKNLKEHELYIDYAKAGEYYYIFSLDNKEQITFTQIDENSTKEIDTLVQTFREDLTTILDDANITDEKLTQLTAASKEKLSRLYEIALHKPLSKELSSKQNLILSPDGALRLLPFEAMFDKTNNTYLIEQKEIRYIPSGKELVRLYKYSNIKTTKPNTNQAVIISNPNFDAEDITKVASVDQEEIAITPNTSRAGIIKSLFRMRFNPLPGTKAEAASIKTTLKAKNLLEYKQEQANEANLMKVEEPKILHIATHGFFINDNTIPNPMLKSGIALSGANASAIKGKSDGIVTALKLSGLKLKGTDLVVLSACQTGVVDVNSTDSVSGLSKAFIQAGAKDIVMSLWSVNDQATKELMSSFYQEMQNHPSYAKALKEAKLKMIEKGMHPFYWAPFVVSGL